jgi:hypothetical protein
MNAPPGDSIKKDTAAGYSASFAVSRAATYPYQETIVSNFEQIVAQWFCNLSFEINRSS